MIYDFMLQIQSLQIFHLHCKHISLVCRSSLFILQQLGRHLRLLFSLLQRLTSVFSLFFPFFSYIFIPQLLDRNVLLLLFPIFYYITYFCITISLISLLIQIFYYYVFQGIFHCFVSCPSYIRL